MSNKYSCKFLQQPFTATNKLRDWCIAAAKQLMIFRRLNILCQVPRIKITASLTFDQKNICSQLKLLASYSEVFDVTWWRKCHKMIRITDLTEKKLRLQIAGTVGNLYRLQERLAMCMYSLVWRIQHTVAANGCRKESCVVDLRFYIVPVLSVPLW